MLIHICDLTCTDTSLRLTFDELAALQVAKLRADEQRGFFADKPKPVPEPKKQERGFFADKPKPAPEPKKEQRGFFADKPKPVPEPKKEQRGFFADKPKPVPEPKKEQRGFFADKPKPVPEPKKEERGFFADKPKAAPKDDGFFGRTKNQWDRLGPGVNGAVTTTYERPDLEAVVKVATKEAAPDAEKVKLRHAEPVRHQIEGFELEKVILKTMRSQSNSNEAPDPSLVKLFKLLDENKSKTVDIKEIVKCMRDVCSTALS